MSKPRKPFGPNPPGRLPSTMIKVLAAELSDQGRLSRGKRYWADDAVIDIVIGHGAVTAEIQGSRPQPYVVTLEASPGSGVPGKRDVWVRCTCPDDTGSGSEACKHAVAALFALADEVATEPELIERWRGGSAARPQRVVDITERQPERPDEAPSHESLAEVVPLRPGLRQTPHESPPPRTAPPDPVVDEIARMLAAPSGALAPDFPDVSPIAHGGLRQRQLTEVLEDALDHLGINWE